MLHADVLSKWLAERGSAKPDVTKLCADLRAWMYPKQRAFYTSKAKRRATRKTRRMGATVGGVREFIARALETPGWRGDYIASTLGEARKRAWESDTKSGFADVLRQVGKPIDTRGVEKLDVCGVTVELRDADLEVNFSNGSKIELLAFDDERSLRKLRGMAKHVIWPDEAQDLRFLDQFYKAVIIGCLADFKGECWLTGTPGKDCSGFFYDVTKESEPGNEALPGWEIHEMSVTDNPFFGRVAWIDGQWFVVDNIGTQHGPYAEEAVAEQAAIGIRWENTAGEAIRENKWDDDDPDLIREWYGRWVKTDARFVYAVHKRPVHELVYAPCRTVETGVPYDGFPDVKAAMLDLPGAPQREYFLALGADLGTRDAFAFVLWAWSLKDPVLYEVCSWKRSGFDYDEMEACLNAVGEQVHIGLVVGDAGGGGLGAVNAWTKRWNARYHVPIQPANKAPHYKPIAIKQFNTDLKQGRIKYRKDSVLFREHLQHRWLPKKNASGNEVEDPATENHCSDAGLYAQIEAYHHLYREVPPPPKPGSPEFIKLEEQAMEQYAIRQQFDDEW